MSDYNNYRKHYNPFYFKKLFSIHSQNYSTGFFFQKRLIIVTILGFSEEFYCFSLIFIDRTLTLYSAVQFMQIQTTVKSLHISLQPLSDHKILQPVKYGDVSELAAEEHGRLGTKSALRCTGCKYIRWEREWEGKGVLVFKLLSPGCHHVCQNRSITALTRRASHLHGVQQEPVLIMHSVSQ